MLKVDILIVKNISHEGPGLLLNVIEGAGLSYKVLDLEDGDILSENIDYKALVVLGGPDSVNDQNDKIKTELEFVRKSIETGKPYLGICLGLQVMVKSMGGKVVKSPVREIGFRDKSGAFYEVDVVEDALFEGLGNKFRVFHLHGETVELTDNMKLIGTGKHCKNQIVKIGENAYGIQCHFELTEEMFNKWIDIDPELQELNRESLELDFASFKDAYTATGLKLFENFIKISDLV
jgi:GMP synthase-like glutamine amidotransferase